MKMVKGEFAANAFLMEMKGVLNDKDDIAKMIEQSRLEKTALVRLKKLESKGKKEIPSE